MNAQGTMQRAAAFYAWRIYLAEELCFIVFYGGVRPC